MNIRRGLARIAHDQAEHLTTPAILVQNGLERRRITRLVIAFFRVRPQFIICGHPRGRGLSTSLQDFKTTMQHRLEREENFDTPTAWAYWNSTERYELKKKGFF
jgi:hypothetical protein